jgi:hypothetical protein
MKDQHRIRMTDAEVDEVVSALYARLSMRRGARATLIRRLLARLEDGGAGNPSWRFNLGVSTEPKHSPTRA